MKKFSFILLGIALTASVACNSKSANDNKEKTNTTATQPTQPANTSAAEKTPEPTANPEAAAAGLKEHVCTDKCKDGTHVYAHGEKGHVCTEECKKG